MKRIFALMLLMMSFTVHSAITDLRLSTAQIFDVQWNISGGRLNASGFNYIYASVNYATQTNSAARWTLAQTQDAGANGRYIGFFNSTTNPGTYGMAVFNSDGTRYKTINNTGTFRALADGAIFYNGNGMWGTLITTAQGYSNGGSGSWAVTQENPTNAQLQAYTPPSSTPLAPGQTAQPSGGGGSAAPEWPATSEITVPQTTSRTAARNRVSAVGLGNAVYLDERIGSSGNNINIEQTGSYNRIAGVGGGERSVIDGDNNVVVIRQGDGVGRNLLEFSVVGNTNSVTVRQARNIATGLADGAESGGHYAGVTISGNSNTLTLRQANDGGAASGHFLSLGVAGSSNSGTITQSGNVAKTLFGTVTGNSNSIVLSQTGAEAFINLQLTGNNHSATVAQSGAGSHRATVNLTNSGGSSTVQLTQAGAVAQNIHIQQQCATLGGCSVNITQGQ